MVESCLVALLQLLQQRQAVHARHVDVAHHHVDVAVGVEHGQRLQPVTGEQEAQRAVADLAAEFLDDQRLEVGLVVDHEDRGGHAASPSRASISLAKRREVDRLGQQRLGAALQRLALGLGVAIGGDHDDGHVGPRGLRLRAAARARSCPAC